MERRGFLLGILAAGMAPAVVKAGVLMPVRPLIIVPAGGMTLLNQGLVMAMQPWQEEMNRQMLHALEHLREQMHYGVLRQYNGIFASGIEQGRIVLPR